MKKSFSVKVFTFVLGFLLLLFSGCSDSDLKQTIETICGDRMQIHAYLSGNLHGMYLHCEIKVSGVKGYAYFSDKRITSIPADISDRIQLIARQQSTRVYRMIDEIIVIHENKIENFNVNYSISDFQREIEINAVDASTIWFGTLALCQTRRFEYISHFLPILDCFQKDEDITSMLRRWANKDFTDEELQINKAYTIDSISKWCEDYFAKQ